MYRKLTLLHRVYQRFVEAKIIAKIYIKVLLNRKKVMKTDLKPEFKEKLLKLKVYRKWEKNRLAYFPVSRVEILNQQLCFKHFIMASFSLANTEEGWAFWIKIAYDE
jgi:hypothetical protein